MCQRVLGRDTGDAVQAAAAEVLQTQAIEVGMMRAWLTDGGQPTAYTRRVDFTTVPEAPSVEEYCSLRVATGLSPRDPDAAAAALPRSLYAVTIRSEQQLIAMGRVVGDGLHVQIVDIAVHPDFQGRGLSRQILEEIMTFISALPHSTFVSLFADVDWLYGKFGFVQPQHTTGMIWDRQSF